MPGISIVATSRFSEEVFHGNSPCPFTDESEPITIHVVCVKLTLVLHYSALFDDNVLCGLLGRLWGCMLATYRSYGGLWGLLDRLWGCMLATYRSYGASLTIFGVCWQPTGLMGVVDRLWGCILATYRSCGGCLTVFGAVCWQPTGLMVPL